MTNGQASSQLTGKSHKPGSLSATSTAIPTKACFDNKFPQRKMLESTRCCPDLEICSAAVFQFSGYRGQSGRIRRHYPDSFEVERGRQRGAGRAIAAG